jgi:chromosome segregation ATPase
MGIMELKIQVSSGKVYGRKEIENLENDLITFANEVSDLQHENSCLLGDYEEYFSKAEDMEGTIEDLRQELDDCKIQRPQDVEPLEWSKDAQEFICPVTRRTFVIVEK